MTYHRLVSRPSNPFFSTLLVLVVQDHLLDYMQKHFDFGHVSEARIGDAFHLYSYQLTSQTTGEWRLELMKRISTDVAGVQKALGLQATAKVELTNIVAQLEAKVSDRTLITFV